MIYILYLTVEIILIHKMTLGILTKL
jgi:hypothetical protein